MNKTITLSIAALAVSACVPPNLPWAGPGYTSNNNGGAASSGGTATPQRETARAPERLSVTGSSKALQRVTSDQSTHEGRPKLALDGSKLLASTWRDEVVDGQYTGNAVDQEIVALRPDGKGKVAWSKRGVSAHSAAWLPKTFVYVSNAMGDPQLVRAAKPSPGAAVSVIVRADDAPSIGAISSTRDGKLLAFHALIRDVWTIGTVRPDGTDLMMIGDGAYPKLSPDGTRIAFERQVNGQWQIFTMDVEGGDLTQITDDASTHGSVEWSPDAQWLVFSSNAGAARFPNGSAETTWNLFAIRPDGTGLVQLTDGPRKATEPAWGSDGWLYFASDEGGTYDLWRIKPALD
jgi:TolB protein